jgi:hypothetical protein
MRGHARRHDALAHASTSSREHVVTLADVIGIVALAMLEGSLVALPRAGALAGLARLQSPAWAAALPGAILIGTFAPLWHESLASALVVTAAVTTPLLALIGKVGVARAPGALFIGSALTLSLVAIFSRGTATQLTITLVAALGAMSLGVSLTRLIPASWLILGVVLMSAVDVALIAAGVGQAAAGSMATASAHFHGPEFSHAAVGNDTLDYPDLVLAAILGGAVAGSPLQRRAAVTLALLSSGWGLLLAVVHYVPATPPIALTFGLLAVWQRSSAKRALPGPAAKPCRHTKPRAGLPAWHPALCGCS